MYIEKKPMYNNNPSFFLTINTVKLESLI